MIRRQIGSRQNSARNQYPVLPWIGSPIWANPGNRGWFDYHWFNVLVGDVFQPSHRCGGGLGMVGRGWARNCLTLSRTRSARRIFSGHVRDWRLFCHCACRSSICSRSVIQELAFKTLPGIGQVVPGCQTHDGFIEQLRQFLHDLILPKGLGVHFIFRKCAECTPWGRIDIPPGGFKSPNPPGGRAVLKLIREHGGGAITGATEDALAAIDELAREEGIFACPESATTLVGLRKSLARGWVAPHERVVLVVTESGLKSIPTLGTPSPPVVATSEEILA